MFDKELSTIKNNPEAVKLYQTGMSNLYQAGVLTFLRTFGRVFRSPKANMEEAALDGAYAAGFQDAIDTLMNFKEYFLDPKPNVSTLRRDYGGANVALARGDLTENEAYELKRTRA